MARTDEVSLSAMTSSAHDSIEARLCRLERERSITSFLYHETDLLDAKRFEEWLALFADDGRYWIPLDWVPATGARAAEIADDTPARGVDRVNIVYDDRRRLRERVDRMVGGAFWDETPPSRVIRLVTNVHVGPEFEDDQGRSHATVTSKLLVRQVRQTRENVLAGQVFHDLIEVGDLDWRISLKRVTLVNAEKPLWNMTYVL
jgi:ethylbenzene dioxygenase beta subunit